jgi:hypothetical protein
LGYRGGRASSRYGGLSNQAKTLLVG